MAGYCEVALPVPLRMAFTYAVPDAIDELVVPGARVVVPFRNRAMVGVVLERTTRRPAATPLKEIAEVLDPLPALPAHVIELGRWVASYYLAPVGETFRAMLPPIVELRVAREWQITDVGRTYLRELESLTNRSEREVDDLALLQFCEIQGKPIGGELIRKLPGGEVAAARLLRRGQLVTREAAQRRPPRTQKIVAWCAGADPIPERPATARVRQILTEERGPVPLTQLLDLAHVSRSVVERLVRQGHLQLWEEPVAIGESVLEADFTPPSNVLNEDQRRAVGEIRGWIGGECIHRWLALRRYRQRQDRGLPASGGGRTGPEPYRAGARAGDRPDSLGEPLMLRVVWRPRRGVA